MHSRKTASRYGSLASIWSIRTADPKKRFPAAAAAARLCAAAELLLARSTAAGAASAAAMALLRVIKSSANAHRNGGRCRDAGSVARDDLQREIVRRVKRQARNREAPFEVADVGLRRVQAIAADAHLDASDVR